MRVVAVAAAVALSSCATHKPIYLPDGRQGYSVNCSGSALSWDLCYQKAGEICKTNGYNIIAKDGEESSMVTSSQYGTYGTPIINRSLVIACR